MTLPGWWLCLSRYGIKLDAAAIPYASMSIACASAITLERTQLDPSNGEAWAHDGRILSMIRELANAPEMIWNVAGYTDNPAKVLSWLRTCKVAIATFSESERTKLFIPTSTIVAPVQVPSLPPADIDAPSFSMSALQARLEKDGTIDTPCRCVLPLDVPHGVCMTCAECGKRWKFIDGYWFEA